MNSQCQVFAEWSYSWTALVFFLLKTHALKFQKGIATRSVYQTSMDILREDAREEELLVRLINKGYLKNSDN